MKEVENSDGCGDLVVLLECVLKVILPRMIPGRRKARIWVVFRYQFIWSNVLGLNPHTGGVGVSRASLNALQEVEIFLGT